MDGGDGSEDRRDPVFAELIAHNARPRAGRRLWLRMALAVMLIVLLVTAGVAGIVGLLRTDDVEAPPPPSPVAANAALTVVAARGDARVLIRLGDSRGGVLYRGTVKVGQSITVHGTRLWVQLADASRVALAVDGRRVPSIGSGRVRLIVTRDGVVE
jgi:hypothetical protein